MDFEELYPSRFLRAGDLADAPLPVTISGISRENIGGEQKVVMSFAGGQKNLIVNKTNGKALCKLFGRDTEEWIGKKITLVPTEVDFKGDMVEAIRIRTTPPSKGAGRVASPLPTEPSFNDDVGI